MIIQIELDVATKLAEAEAKSMTDLFKNQFSQTNVVAPGVAGAVRVYMKG